MKRSRRLAQYVIAGAAALVALSASCGAYAQSADLVLCDRLAADPADPDKPADVKGVATVAAGDVATAIKFCKQASNSRRAMYQLGRAYAANRQTNEAIGAWRKAADKAAHQQWSNSAAYATGAGVNKDEAAAAKLSSVPHRRNPRGVSNLAALSGKGAAPADAALARVAGQGRGNQCGSTIPARPDVAGWRRRPEGRAGARNLFEKAAAQDHPGALERMGAFAKAGRGGPQDTSAAKAYYEKAAALGNARPRRRSSVRNVLTC